MGTLNINSKVTDIFYRYKMPRILAKVEGKGNGIKTVIVNMAEVAKALNRPATYPTKYFGCELGAQTQFDHKNERFIVNGSHDASKLQELLDVFIRKYVLCPECDNPETDLLVSAKKGTISQGCKACGFHGPLEVNHKVNTYILKNPPNINPASQGSSKTEGKRSKRSTKRDGENNTSTASNGDDDDEPYNKSKIVNDEEDDDAEWTVDVSEAAVRARMEDLTDGAKNITISEDAEKTEKERLDIFYEYVKKRRDQAVLDNVQVHKELATEANRLDVQQKAPLVLAELIFSVNIIAEIRKHRNLLLRFTHDDPKAQKYLLGGVEQIISLNAAKLMEKVAGILKLFYENDILEEKALLEWDSKVSKKYVSKEIAQQIHDKAKPFIKWLQEAEEEESDEDSEDVEIEYDDRAKIDSLKSKPVAPIVAKKSEEDDGEELDIDDI
ncbi:unnamed protein product [Diamesa serratosioi]